MTLYSVLISLLIAMKRQDLVLMCNINGLVAEQWSPKGRLHNPFMGEESQRGFGRSPFVGWETIPVWNSASLWSISLPFSYFISQQQKIDLDESCKSLNLCKMTVSGLHQQRLPARRQLCVNGSIILCDRIMKSYSIQMSLLLMRHLEHALI